MKKGSYDRNLIFKSFAILFVFALTFLLLINFTAAQLTGANDQAVTTGGKSLFEVSGSGWFSQRFEIWKSGVTTGQVCTGTYTGTDGKSCSDFKPDASGKVVNCPTASGCSLQDVKSLVGETLKYLVLFLIIFLTYSALTYGNLPQQVGFRIAISVIVGFLATFTITTNELLTMLYSYTALGVALSVFFPIVILGFFTMVVASKGSPMGIFIQKIAWVIYSVYLFFKTVFLYYIVNCFNAQGVFQAGICGKDASGGLPYLAGLFQPFMKNYTVGQVSTLIGNSDATMTFVLFITAIAVFVIMVLGNKYVDHWLAKEKFEAELQAEDQRVRRTRAYEDSKSGILQQESKK